MTKSNRHYFLQGIAMKHGYLMFMIVVMMHVENIFASEKNYPFNKLPNQIHDEEMVIASPRSSSSSLSERSEQSLCSFSYDENSLSYNSEIYSFDFDTESGESNSDEENSDSLSYNEEREPLMSDEEGSDADDDVDTDSVVDETSRLIKLREDNKLARQKRYQDLLDDDLSSLFDCKR